MTNASDRPKDQKGMGVVSSVAFFWFAYVALTLGIGFLSRWLVDDPVWAHIVWTMLAGAGVFAVTKFMVRIEKGPRTSVNLGITAGGMGMLAVGYLLGFAAFALHLCIVNTFAGGLEFDRVAGIGLAAAALFFTKYLFASIMEELGFRGYALQRLEGRWGAWPAVLLTSVAFGLSHLNYGWSLDTIIFGVVPNGILWGMAALATRGISLPIGLHASWNFSHWVVGDKSDPGLFQIAVSEDAAQLTQTVATVSNYSIYIVLIAVFWFIYRKNTRPESES